MAAGELGAEVALLGCAETGEARLQAAAPALLTRQVSVHQSGLSDTARPRLLAPACPVLGLRRNGGDRGYKPVLRLGQNGTSQTLTPQQRKLRAGWTFASMKTAIKTRIA